MILRLALRNLRRHRWRSVLTAGGIALAVGMLVWTKAWIDTFVRDMVHAATAVEIAQVQVRTPEYAERASIYRSFAVDDGLVEAVRSTEGVTGASLRTYAHGLVGTEERSHVARLVGIVPAAESEATLLDEGVVEGSWLSDAPAEIPGPRECLIGHHLARQLGVGVGDELVVFLQGADGSLGNDLLLVRGVLETGNSVVDRTTVVMHRDDLAFAAALEGRAHEIVVSVAHLDQAGAVAAGIDAVLPDEDGAPEAYSWSETLSDLATMIETNQASMWITYLLVYAIAGLGLLNTQRMSALERKREFGVLTALGTRPRRIGAMVVTETVALTAFGALGGIVLGGGLALWHKRYGLDVAALTSREGGDMAFMGVAFSERMYFEVDAMSMVEPAIVVLFVALVCGLIPGWSAMRVDAVRAISGRS
jgi:ABC-type lipoprotein release transport system permease subunit